MSRSIPLPYHSILTRTSRLNPSALAALQDFYSERSARESELAKLSAAAERAYDEKLTMDVFAEDWQASQFWYTESTASTLARAVLGCGSKAIAVVSAPSVYVALRNELLLTPESERPRVVLLEVDERFAVFGGDFVRYDFNRPTALPGELKAAFDCVVCDPPFLAEDCQTRTAMTVRWLSSGGAGKEGKEEERVRMVTCTGERMTPLVHRLYGQQGLRTTTFLPEHAKGLSNEFRCFANFACEAWELT